MKYKELLHELKHHVPFTALATVIAIVLAIYIKSSEGLFHILHPLHILASSIVTTAIFYKYKKSSIQAILIGITGAIIIGSLSDIIFPWLGGNLLNLNTEFHLLLIQEPIIVLSAALIGSIIGIATGMTKMPHLFHVLLSVFASMTYLLAFSGPLNYIGAFFIIFIAVIIPCCISDILFPFLFLGEKIKKCNC